MSRNILWLSGLILSTSLGTGCACCQCTCVYDNNKNQTYDHCVDTIPLLPFHSCDTGYSPGGCVQYSNKECKDTDCKAAVEVRVPVPDEEFSR